MQNWEYRKFETRGTALTAIDNEPSSVDNSTDLQQLNAMGLGGWELISVTLNSAGFSTFFLKRPKA
ncbi:MAG TPA: hypothetical protein VKY85_23525 [Candidatus Angelobacter sp.]|jgi:hypothetical protein|nr:hypothetical protein [Candidatus Angelobacter sp.]